MNDEYKRLTEEQRNALLTYLDALLRAWSLSPTDSGVEEVLSDAIDEVTERLLMAESDKFKRIDDAAENTHAKTLSGLIAAALSEDEEEAS